MQDLIAPHGGLKEPINRLIPAEEAADFRRQAATLKPVPVSDADLSSLYRIGDGGLSPLTGPMHKTAFEQVLNDEILVHQGKAYAWTIPIAFPADRVLAGSLKLGENVALINGREEVVGTLRVGDIFPFEKLRYIKSVYGTERTDHPGGRMALNDPREMLLGGEVRVLPQPKHPEYGHWILSPRETRALFRETRLEARRCVSNAQPAPPRPRIRPCGRDRTLDPRRPFRRGRAQPSCRRNQGR